MRTMQRRVSCATLTLALTLSLSLSIQAESSGSHGNMMHDGAGHGGMMSGEKGMPMADDAMWADAEVRKVDPSTGKITLKHGPIQHMDMPGMTMVFTAKDKAVLEGVQPGDQIRFKALHEQGQMWVTEIQKVPAQ